MKRCLVVDPAGRGQCILEPHKFGDHAFAGPIILSPATTSTVNNPSHYGGADNPHEHWKCAQAWGLVDTPLIGAWLYNASKYICRAGKKSGAPPVEDLKKAIWYIDRAVKRLEEK